MAVVLLNVPDISCDHCERAIRNALSSEKGIRGIVVDIPAKQVQVDYDAEQIDLGRVREILEEEDYPVESVA